MFTIFKSLEEIQERIREDEDAKGLQFVTASRDGCFGGNGMLCG